MLDLPSPIWSAHRRRLEDEVGARWLTEADYRVLVVIANLHHLGDHQPTVRRIAVEARVTPRQVRRTRAKAEARGLLEVRANYDETGPRRRQLANTYEPLTPEGPVLPKPRPARLKGGGGLNVRPISSKKEKKEESVLSQGEIQAARAALLARQAVIAARLRC